MLSLASGSVAVDVISCWPFSVSCVKLIVTCSHRRFILKAASAFDQTTLFMTAPHYTLFSPLFFSFLASILDFMCKYLYSSQCFVLLLVVCLPPESVCRVLVVNLGTTLEGALPLPW